MNIPSQPNISIPAALLPAGPGRAARAYVAAQYAIDVEALRNLELALGKST